MRYFITILLFATTCTLNAQTDDGLNVRKNILILQSTKSYAAALKTARDAASSLACKLELRGLKPNKEEGLTLSPAACDSNGWEFPCYVARGRYDDGDYISIERSDAYEGFRKGYYIVIGASGNTQSNDVRRALAKAHLRFKDAYLKTMMVYMGCMH